MIKALKNKVGFWACQHLPLARAKAGGIWYHHANCHNISIWNRSATPPKGMQLLHIERYY